MFEVGPRPKGTPTPGVFCKKRLDLLDSKGVEFFGVTKRLQVAEKEGC